MSEREFTRRSVLAGATAAGVLGSIGGGTVALLNDRESFSDRITSGILDLNVEWSVDGEESGDSEGVVPAPIEVTEDDPSGAATLTPRLPGGENNPAYVWLRTTCPDPALPATALQVELSYENGGVIIGPTSLLSFADTLRNGIPLDPDGDAQVAVGDQGCLSSDQDFDLRFRWWLDEDFSDEARTAFAFEFVGGQCRHADGTSNPFDTVESCDAGHALSFLAFGTDSDVDDTEIDPVIRGVNSWDEDGPVSVDWGTDAEVDYVVAYFGSTLGPQMTIYDYRDRDFKTRGTATAGDPGAAITAYDVEKPSGGKQSAAAKPCEVADRLLDGNGSFSLEATTKLEYSESNSWTEEGE
jgi:predicted ribosomally synthesized peptide with SipW-like signal peptide